MRTEGVMDGGREGSAVGGWDTGSVGEYNTETDRGN